MGEWYAASEMAGLPGLPTTDRRVRTLAQREGWKSRPRSGKGGGLEYHISALPLITQNAILAPVLALSPVSADPLSLAAASKQAPSPGALESPVPAPAGAEGSFLPAPAALLALSALPVDPAATPPAPAATPHPLTASTLTVATPGVGTPAAPAPASGLQMVPRHRAAAPQHQAQARTAALPAVLGDDPVQPTPLADWQRRVRDARLTVLGLVDDLAAHLGGTPAAIDRLLAIAAAGELPDTAARALIVANARHGDGRPPAAATLYRWMKARGQGPDALAPRPAAAQPWPTWLPDLLALYQDPAKPSLAACLRHLTHQRGAAATPPARTAARWLAHLPAAITQWGRQGHRARRAIKPFIRRSTDGLWPMDIVAVDGHAFKAWVGHPLSGERYRPEITTYLDIATRRIVGWSAWVAESQYAIWLALRAMVTDPTAGVPALHYSDNGAYRGDQHRALLERIGTAQTFSLPGNPQANGAIERLNASLWLPAARQLPLYAGKSMDKDAFKARKRRADTSGEGIVPFADFLHFLREQVAAYNGREHASLRRGRQRLSPDGAWALAVEEGWQPTLLAGDDLHDLLPSVNRVTRRGEVSLPWGRYFSRDLAGGDPARDQHGHSVRVHYDPANGDRVWVCGLEGRLLAIAGRDANVRPYMPATAIEDARAKREAARVKRLERRVDRVHAEELPLIEAHPIAADAARLPDLVLPTVGAFRPDRVPVPLARDLPDLVLPAPGAYTPAAPGPAVALSADLPRLHAERDRPRHYIDNLMTDPQRYETWCVLRARQRLGEPLDDRETAFFTGFGASDYCRRTDQLWADFERQMGAGGGGER